MTELKGHLAHLAPRQREEIERRIESGTESMRRIAQDMGVAPSTISRSHMRYLTTGDLVEHLSGGHASSYDDDDMYRLECLIDQHRSATAFTLRTLMGTSAPSVSLQTIDTYRHVLGYTRRKPVIWHIDTERSAKQRDAWVLEHKHADHTKWVYMDESTLCLRDTGDYVWVKAGEAAPPQEIRHLRCHVSVWGAVWNDGAVFSLYTGHLNSASYIELLNTHLTPHKQGFHRRTILHDRASYHKSKETTAWFNEQGFDILLMPPHSPQFNAIERVWGWLKRKVRQRRPFDHVALQMAMREAWEQLPQSVIQTFINEAHENIVAH
jgi:transposase